MISLKILWRNLFRKSQLDEDLSAELASFTDLLTDEKINAGLSGDVARRRALLEIGGIEQVKEQVRDVRRGSFVETILRDMQQSARSLRRSPGLTILAIGTLALGLGATTLIFSVFYSVLLQPLPFQNPERLVQLWETRVGTEFTQASFSRVNFWDVQAQNKTFESLGALLVSDMNLTGKGDPRHLSAGFVSSRFFHVLGVSPVVGRDFSPTQDHPGEDGVVLLSNKFWISHLASSPDVVGATLHLDGRAYTVIGVMPRGEPWLDVADVFVPLVYEPSSRNRGNFEASVIGRLAPGVNIAAAHDDLERIAGNLAGQYKEDRGMGIRISPSEVWGARPQVRQALWVLLGAVTFLLLIACVNIANLLLSKGTARSRELKLREALGASRWRIVRLLLTESVILGCLGAALGLLIAALGIHLIRTAELSGIPRLSEIGINGRVLAFTLAATLFSGIVSGLMPAMRSSSGDLATSLREGDRSQTASRSQNFLRAMLVTAEVALSMMLLIGAGLLIRSFSNILTVDRGFQTAHRVIAAVNIPFNYSDERAQDINRKLLERVDGLPGVEAAGIVNSKPIVGWDPGMGFGAPDSIRSVNGEVPWASWRYVSDGYFHAMGIRLIKGRRFQDSDFNDETRRVIVSDSVAQSLWPGQDPIGRQMILWKGQGNRPAQVIGVVGNMRDHGLDADPTRVVYIPNRAQWYSPAQVVVRSSLSAAAVASSLRSILAGIDPAIPVSEAQTMDELVGQSLGSVELNTTLLSAFALIALLLSMTGIYGVLSYAVSRRTAEIGIRVTLGADRRSIFKLVLLQGMQPIVVGIAIGIASSLAVTRFLSGLLFQVTPADAISYVAVTLLIAATALLACLLPARRAVRVDPVTALREA
jgi:predicted permease